METIRKMILALCTVLGGVIIFTLLKELTPQWVFYTVLSAFSLFVLYYVSKPDKTYWYYTYVAGAVLGTGMIASRDKYFPMNKALEAIPKDAWVVNATSVSVDEYADLVHRMHERNKGLQEQSSTTPQP